MSFFKWGFALVLSSLLFMASCSKEDCIVEEGSLETITLNINDISGIDLAMNADVVIIQGTEQSVIAKGHANVVNEVSKSVSNGIWTIEMDNTCGENYNLTFYVVVPNLHQVKLSGSGDVSVANFINQGHLFVDISGSGDVFIDSYLSLGDLDANISGSGDIIFNGGVSYFDEMDLMITGSGTYQGFGAQLDKAYISIHGSGNAEVRVSDYLFADIPGSGSVYYKGYPTIVTDIDGSGGVFNWN